LVSRWKAIGLLCRTKWQLWCLHHWYQWRQRKKIDHCGRLGWRSWIFSRWEIYLF
jgi:hypothetical protein